LGFSKISAAPKRCRIMVCSNSPYSRKQWQKCVVIVKVRKLEGRKVVGRQK
jgi:hypothetical protein